MIRPSRLQPPNDPILGTEDGHTLVKSPGSYTSPDTTKPSLFGNGAISGKEKSEDADYSRMDPDDMFARYSVAEIRTIRARLLSDADGKREELRQMLSKSPDEEESEEEEAASGDVNWSRHGIDVMEQFPVASKQWEMIGQFRPQIVHKATQALRESNVPHRETAETLIAILLLDALSTARTRDLFLSQRSKTLTSLLNPPLSTSRRPISPNRAQNRKATAALLSPAASPRSTPLLSTQLLKTPITPSTANIKSERKTVREVLKAFRAVVSIVGGTVATARAIYGADGLLAQIIMDIQTDTTSQNIPSTASQTQFPMSSTVQPLVSVSRNLTTRQILHSLPSSSLLLRFLPPSITGYTPYVSTDSGGLGATKVEETEGELDSWLNNALEALAAPSRDWLSKLESVRAVWAVRTAIIKGILGLEGAPETKNRLLGAIEAAFISRVSEVWESRLETIEVGVGSALRRVTALLGDFNKDAKDEDANPLAFVYSSELPTIRTEPGGDTSFRLFKDILQRRANRRTALLDSVLSEMEAASQELREELDVALGEDNSGETVIRLTSSYQPRAAEACMRIANAVSKALDDAVSNGDKATVNVTVFVGRLANALVNHSTFIANLSCSQDTTIQVKDSLTGAHNKSIDLWCVRSSEHALAIYQPAFESCPSRGLNMVSILRPSNHLISALVVLTSSINSLGMTLDELWAKSISNRLLSTFESLLVAGMPVEHAPDQVVWDLMFLKEMQRVQESQDKDAANPGNGSSASMINSHFQKYSEEDRQTVNATLRDQLARSQLLLSTLIGIQTPSAQSKQPRAQNTLLPLGVPPTETDFRPALDLVKPCTRFGMLPVPNTQAH
ncbi:hypothetical protein RSAG8_03172, partial [Rhizoctonia solani AG-8 WAC10335]